MMRGKRDHSRRLIAFAKKMRGDPTDAEKKLWFLLRH
jgi:very-short-patch-repair endonuclease